MIIRLVKMSFKKDKVDDFMRTFDESKYKILRSEGIIDLQLIRDKNNKNLFFTISKWEEEKYLEQYRNSELFKSTWARTKILFDEKPTAWSTTNVFNS